MQSAGLEYIVRPYGCGDRSAVQAICAATGLKGAPIDTIWSDKTLFAEMITSYFLDNEPQGASILENKGSAVGYCIGSKNGKQAENALIIKFLRTAPSFVKRSIMDYSARDRSFLWNVFLSLPHAPQTPAEGGTVHFNILPGHRVGYGIEMIKIFERYLQNNGVRQYFGQVFQTERVVAGVKILRHSDRLYERFGFTIYDRRRLPRLDLPTGEKVYGTTILKVLP